MIGCSKKIRETCPWVSAKRPSNNWALVIKYLGRPNFHERNQKVKIVCGSEVELRTRRTNQLNKIRDKFYLQRD